MTKALRILQLEDRPADAELVTRALRKEGIQFSAHRVMTEADFLAQLREFTPDLILADYSLPDYDGLSALAAAQRERPEVPFIFVSGELGEERAIEALRHGATDYVLKQRLSRLGAVVRRALKEREEKNQRQQAEEKLRAAEGRYRALFEQSPDGIVIIDPATARFVDFNTTAHQQLGYSREEFARLGIPDLEAVETPAETRERIAKVVREGRDDFETRQRTKQGEIRHIHVTAQIVESAGGPVYHCIWRDITERKRAEERISKLNQLLRAMREINQIIVQQRDPHLMLADACNVLVRGRGLPLVWVGLVEPGSKRVVPVARAGETADFLDKVTVTWDDAPTGRGPVGTAIRSGQPSVCQDIATDPGFAPWRELALTHSCASVAAIPMVHAGHVLGAVNVYSRRTGTFDTEELALLSELAADLALALHGLELENQRRQAEARMRLLSQALESAANAIVITDREGRISWANPAFTQLTGYSLAEALSQKLSLLKSGLHDQPFYQALWETVLAGKVWSAVMINRRKDGTRYTEENTITPVRDEHGEITHFIAVKQDITERQRAAEALHQREEYFRALTEKATDITTVLNADGTFRYASPSVRQVLGYTPEELVGRLAFDYIHPEDLVRLKEIFSAVVETAGAGGRHEFRLRHKEGTWRALEATARNLLDDPNVAGVVVNSRDITERQQLEQQLRQAQKMEAVGQLAGGVAHDFNNMLAVVRGNAELLLMNADEHTSETTDCLKQITAASERATNLTRQLLAFSRKQVMQSQPLVLNDVIADVTKMLKRIIGEHIDLQCRCGAQLPFVQADAGMIEQVLVNLAVNARDAMPHGGQLLITTEPVTFEETPGPAHPEARAGQFACLAVSDTGTGIAPEHLLRIFEPFFTTKEPGKGTGLGLATVYGIVQQHQGWIEVFTQPGAGTTFKIFLPVVPPPPGTPAAARAETKVSGGVETILLVEDDYAMRMVTRRVLESQGYQIYEATTAREALEVWRSHAGEIALLLTDIVMPEGITGCDLTEQLRAQRPALKVVLMSGYSADVISQNSDFLQCTKSGFLQKPFSTQALLQIVRRHLDEK